MARGSDPDAAADPDGIERLWASTLEACDDDEAPSSRRAVCPDCERPASSCPCAWLPESPLPTRGALVVLTHPNERKRAVRTGWILPRCFRRAVLCTRREPPAAFLDMLDGPDAILPRDAPTYILYPAPRAVSVAEANLREDGLERAEAEARRTSSRRPSSSASSARRPADPRDSAPAAAAELAAVAAALEGAAYVCVAIDSTWRQAREMAAKTAASMPVGTKLVRLPTDRDPGTPTETETETARRCRVEVKKKKSPGPGGDDDETGFPTTGTTGTLPAAPVVDLMVAPAEGCVLTAEAAAAAVRALERRGAFEKEAEAAATSAAATLRAMARSRCMHDPATRAGPLGARAGGGGSAWARSRREGPEGREREVRRGVSRERKARPKKVLSKSLRTKVLKMGLFFVCGREPRRRSRRRG